MGYSARYHAASLVAVFLALAVGILIGAGLGDNLVSDTEQNLRDSLEGDIEDARVEADDLQVALDRERAFSSRAYPALVGDRLRVWVSAGSRPAFVIPAGYVKTRFGIDYVQLVQAGRTVDVPVQRGRALPGPSLADGLEILSGIRAGDQLVRP